MVDAAPPRPRPKPRPVAKNQTSSSGSIPSTSKDKISAVDDGVDDMFMRNKTRTTKDWEKLNRLARANEKKSRRSDSEGDSDGTPRKRKAVKKAQNDWKNSKNVERLMSLEASSDEDDVMLVGESKKVSPNAKGKQHEGDKQRRSRSRSITPPPSIPISQLQHARNVVRHALGGNRRAESPTSIDDDADESNDSVDLDPELLRIQQRIRAEAQRQSSTPTGDTQDSDEVVILRVKWQPHPLRPDAKEDVWAFKLKRHDNFHALFEAVAEEASILVHNLVMTHKGRQLFASVTPHTLHIWGEADLVACDKATHEYLRSQANKGQGLSKNQPVDLDSDMEMDASAGANEFEDDPMSEEHANDESDHEDEDNTFKIVLRSSQTAKDVTLTVRRTTKCGAIIKAFLRNAGLAERYPNAMNASVGKSPKTNKRKSVGGNPVNRVPKLSIDGDKVDNDTVIGDFDLEDGDMVDVVDL